MRRSWNIQKVNNQKQETTWERLRLFAGDFTTMQFQWIMGDRNYPIGIPSLSNWNFSIFKLVGWPTIWPRQRGNVKRQSSTIYLMKVFSICTQTILHRQRQHNTSWVWGASNVWGVVVEMRQKFLKFKICNQEISDWMFGSSWWIPNCYATESAFGAMCFDVVTWMMDWVY